MWEKLWGYQYGATSSFGTGSRGQGTDSHYVGGVSLIHGSAGRRQHIWTFAAGLDGIFACTAYPMIVLMHNHGNVSPLYILQMCHLVVNQ